MLLGRLQSASDQIDLLLRCRDAPLGLLLESVEDIYGSLELDRIHRAVRVPIEHAGNEFAPPSTAPSATSCALPKGSRGSSRTSATSSTRVRTGATPSMRDRKGDFNQRIGDGDRCGTRGAWPRWVEYRDQGEFGMNPSSCGTMDAFAIYPSLLVQAIAIAHTKDLTRIASDLAGEALAACPTPDRSADRRIRRSLHGAGMGTAHRRRPARRLTPCGRLQQPVDEDEGERGALVA